MFVRVNKAEKGKWYANKIGRVFKVIATVTEWGETIQKYHVSKGDPINVDDCDIVAFDSEKRWEDLQFIYALTDLCRDHDKHLQASYYYPLHIKDREGGLRGFYNWNEEKSEYVDES